MIRFGQEISVEGVLFDSLNSKGMLEVLAQDSETGYPIRGFEQDDGSITCRLIGTNWME